MRIFQFVSSLLRGSAVGNEVFAIYDLLERHGFETAIYTEHLGNPESGKYTVITDPYNNLTVNEQDLLIVHLAGHSILHYWISDLKCRKAARYHNVTPPKFFTDYCDTSMALTGKGIDEIKMLSNTFDYCIAVSEFNKQDLISYGYRCPIDVVPILVQFEDYEQIPNREVLDRYTDGKTNLLFVGRVVPNKKQEDIIAAFSAYKKLYNANSRLFLVGSYNGMEVYKARLEDYVSALGLSDDVVFTGSVPLDELLAYYKLADIFLCMSEHEGFCVPLIEAMYFNVPIVAYAAGAVPETLGGAGVLVAEKSPPVTAGMIDKIVKSKALSDDIVGIQRERLEFFSQNRVGELFSEKISAFCQGSIGGDNK